jgi:holo-[acyl-carrier protein] synthase
MIRGIGTDIVEIKRIKNIISRNEKTFIDKIFTENEIRESEKRTPAFEYFAGRWAAKEATAKALGCGIGVYCEWKDIETSNGANGKPHITLTGRAVKTAEKILADRIHVSISHEKDYACAFVVLEG